MPKQILKPKGVPAAIGPYSVAVRAGDALYVSGQIPLDPESGQLVDDTIENATRRVLENLKAVVMGCELTLKDVVKVTIYLSDMNDFGVVNAIYAEYFAEEPPTRATVQAAALPKNSKVEMDCIAHFGS